MHKSLLNIYSLLFDAYGEQHWWPAQTPFEMMCGAILTQNTAWGNVEKAIANFGGRLNPALILAIDTTELAVIIRPSGFFNQKAERLKALAAWFDRYDCDTKAVSMLDPETVRGELLAISGVGRETADSIMLYAFGKPFFVVDAYTRRIFGRLGFTLPDDYEGIRTMFEVELAGENSQDDAALYNEYHALIVRHAKLHCKKTTICADCPLMACCSFYKTTEDENRQAALNP